MTPDVKGGHIIFLASELFCLAILSISEKTFFRGDLEITNYYITYYNSAFLITFFAPLLIGLGLIAYAFNINGKKKTLNINNKRISLTFIIIICSVILGIIFFIHGISNMDEISLRGFSTSYIFYLIFLVSLWGVIYIIHRFIISLIER